MKKVLLFILIKLLYYDTEFMERGVEDYSI
jgi:hypothetical protein